VVNISAKVDYGVQVLCVLATSCGNMTAWELATSQNLPYKYLESILNDMRKGGLLVSKRGVEGGYELARPASDITLSHVIEILVGTLAEVRGQRVEHSRYDGSAQKLQDVWIAIRDNLQCFLDEVTVEDIVSGELPDPMRGLEVGSNRRRRCDRSGPWSTETT